MHSLLKVSDAVNLAMHASAILASEPEKLMAARELATRLDASEATLSKAMQQLVRASLVTSTRGPAGGFRLARDPARIKLKSIVEAIEGPLAAPECLFGRRLCDRDECLLGDTLGRAHRMLEERLETMTLDRVPISLIRRSSGRPTKRSTRRKKGR